MQKIKFIEIVQRRCVIFLKKKINAMDLFIFVVISILFSLLVLIPLTDYLPRV